MTAWVRRERGAALDIHVERFGSTVVLGLAGRLTVESDTTRFGRLARRIARSCATHLVVDLEWVRQLDCTGIGLLLLVRREFGRRGGVVVLAGVERRQEQLLRLAGLGAAFPVFHDRREAIAWCGSSPHAEPRVPEVPVGCFAAAAELRAFPETAARLQP